MCPNLAFKVLRSLLGSLHCFWMPYYEIHFVMDCNMTINISERRIRLDNITADYNNFEKLDKISQFKYSFFTENTLHFAWPGKCLHTCFRKCILVLRCVMFKFSTMIFYRGVPGFATDCRSGVSCRGLITCLLYVGPLFKNLVWNDNGFVRLHNGEKPFHCFDYVFTYILMPHNMVKLYLICLLFMAQIVLYCLHGTLVLSFYMDIVLTLPIRISSRSTKLTRSKYYPCKLIFENYFTFQVTHPVKLPCDQTRDRREGEQRVTILFVYTCMYTN